MRIELDSLGERGGRFSHVYRAEELFLEDDIRAMEPAEVHGEIRRQGNEVELRGDLDAKIQVACGRCLAPVVLPVHTCFTERFVPAVSWRSEEQHELREDELNLAVFDGAAIEIDDVVREEILLAMPSHILCRDDCKGLCPICGIDRNVSSCQCGTADRDSHWHALENLRF